MVEVLKLYEKDVYVVINFNNDRVSFSTIAKCFITSKRKEDNIEIFKKHSFTYGVVNKLHSIIIMDLVKVAKQNYRQDENVLIWN